MKVKSNIFFFFVLMSSFGFSQNTALNGSVKGEEGVENIHVINRSQELFATTNDKGVFSIEAKINDTIVFTSVQYKLVKHIVTLQNITSKRLDVSLNVQVNELPEAIIGFTLTGDLTKDILNSETERPIDFYDFGIPGYTGKPKTKTERKLNEATSGGGLIPLNLIVNAISGRTKMLKKHIALEENTKKMNAIRNRLSEVFFKQNELKEELRTDFFYFCAEDGNFKNRCGTNDLETLKFLKEKYIKYKENLALKK